MENKFLKNEVEKTRIKINFELFILFIQDLENNNVYYNIFDFDNMNALFDEFLNIHNKKE